MKPSTFQDAITIIQTTFPESELHKWAANSKDFARTHAHMELGAWIRNQWVHGGSPLVTEIQRFAWFLHDDDISSVIMEALWHVLNGKPCPSIQELVPSSHWSDATN